MSQVDCRKTSLQINTDITKQQICAKMVQETIAEEINKHISKLLTKCKTTNTILSLIIIIFILHERCQLNNEQYRKLRLF